MPVAAWRAFPSSCVFLLLPVLFGATARAADEIHWTITGPTSVTFDWRGAETTLDYGTAPGVYDATAIAVAPSPLPDSSPGPFQEAALTGLAPNTLYWYRIGAGPAHTFRTPPPPGSSDFWIADLADVGSSLTYAGVAPTQAQVAADQPAIAGDDRPRFVIVQGDLSYGDQDGITRVDAHFNDVQAWSLDAAYMPSWGNHEWECDTCAAKVDNLNDYEGRFELPNTQSIAGAARAVGNGPADDWGWFDYGNTRFISMPALDMSGARTAWQTGVAPVMAAAQADPSIAFIVVYGHFPAWSSGSDHGGSTSQQTTFTTLHASYPKFVLALQGHSHHYERSIPAATGGILNIVSGGGGSTCGGLTATAPAWSQFRMNHLHHLKLHFLPDRIQGFAVCGPNGGGATDACDPDGIADRWELFADGSVTGVSEPPRAMAGRDGAYYDILGRRVEGPLRRGVYFQRRGTIRRMVVVR